MARWTENFWLLNAILFLPQEPVIEGVSVPKNLNQQYKFISSFGGSSYTIPVQGDNGVLSGLWPTTGKPGGSHNDQKLTLDILAAFPENPRA